MSASSTSDLESNSSPVLITNAAMPGSHHHQHHSSSHGSTIHKSHKLALTHLQPGESLETIRCSTQDMAHFKGNVGRLTHDIHSAADRITNSTQEQNEQRASIVSNTIHSSKRHHERNSSRKSPLSRHRSANEKTSPRLGRAGFRNSQVACHSCNRVNSPEWRHGPDGPGTLCNVCGLVYAKRKSHRKQHKEHIKQ